MYPNDEVRFVSFQLRYPLSAAGLFRANSDSSVKKEQDRLDIYHKMFLIARREEHHSAPITRNYTPTRILDLGTGTGIWAIDMAE